jgi:hypothetical protein
MTNRKTPTGTGTTAPPKRDGRSQPQIYVVSCERVDEERVVECLVWLLRRRAESKQPAPTPQQSESAIAEDAAEQRREK